MKHSTHFANIHQYFAQHSGRLIQIFTTFACLWMGLLLAFQAAAAHIWAHIPAHDKSQLDRAIFVAAIHGLIVIIIPLLKIRYTWFTQFTFFVGMILFCVALILSATTGDKTWNASAPFGGSTMILSWFFLTWQVARRKLHA